MTKSMNYETRRFNFAFKNDSEKNFIRFIRIILTGKPTVNLLCLSETKFN